MTEKRNQRELQWFQTGGALNFITAVPHCGGMRYMAISLIATNLPKSYKKRPPNKRKTRNFHGCKRVRLNLVHLHYTLNNNQLAGLHGKNF
jgi:hypothetical protein